MSNTNQVRIIGGEHRGRRLRFADLPGLRPTGDRMRETLFNWLQPVIVGARCLDLFAGSGALGLEAASRGAGRVVMVDRARQVARQLRDNVALLGLRQVRVVESDGLAWLRGPAEPFDLVFLDPPFAAGLLAPACDLLVRGGWLAPGARIYLESPARGADPLPPAWTLLREKRMGEVVCRLALVEADSASPSLAEGGPGADSAGGG